jgi:fructose-bisphosphate aldolase / 2-amino-3,7-dideoxy-D-threo-hept-6-ulosonate synthase
MSGRDFRLSRLRVPGTDRYLSVPMDHGISIGPTTGIEDVGATLEAIVRGGASCAVLHKGIAHFAHPHGAQLGLIMHLSASTFSNPDPNDKVIITTIEEAVRLGADAVSTHTNFGAPTESKQLIDLGDTVRDAHRSGLPVLAMAYPRGPDVEDPFEEHRVAGAARAAAECGADLVKTVYTGDIDSFRRVVQGCPVPILVAGGPRAENDQQLLELVAGAVEAGARGVSIGRNVFQHPHPDRMVAAIRAILVDREPPEEARRHLEAPLPA